MQKLSLVVSTSFTLTFRGFKFWTTFQGVPFVSEIFRSVEPKLSGRNIYILLEIWGTFGGKW